MLPERRGQERRTRCRFVWHERRSGFDRRDSRAARLHGAFAVGLAWLRSDPVGLVSVLVLVNCLNFLDYVFTVEALSKGFVEVNPVMATLLADDPSSAGALKIMTILLVSLGIWRMRRHRAILEATVVILGLFTALTAYHLWCAALF